MNKNGKLGLRVTGHVVVDLQLLDINLLTLHTNINQLLVSSHFRLLTI